MRLNEEVSELTGATLSSQALVEEFLYSSRVLPQLSRYGLVSAICLGVDFGAYFALCSAAVTPSLAGAASYAIGMIINYVLSLQFVFDTTQSAKSESRRIVEFLFSGLVGIVLTGSTIALFTEVLHVSPLDAKIVAVGISFAAVFAARRSLVFAS